jgi:signal transduction histidine kinase
MTPPRSDSLPAPVAVPRRLRFLFRLAFVLLLAATLALALDVLHDEKARGHRAYAEGLRKSEAQIAARLRHPTGQLMLLNAAVADLPATPLVPLVLPFGAIDFDDRAKALQAVELAGCGVVYGDGASLCAGIGSNPFAGAFVYVVGQIPTPALVPHRAGQLDLSLAHRAWVEVRLPGGESWRWIAPYQTQGELAALAATSAAGSVPATAAPASAAQRGRLVAFDADAEITSDSRPQREVRGWMWQEGGCIERPDAAASAPAAGAAKTDCPRRTHVSLRLPVPPWREALDARGAAAWPPAGLANTQVRLQLFGPGEGNVLFDSDNPGRGGTAAASAPFALAEFRRLLLPGETLRVQLEGSEGVILEARGAAAADTGDEASLPWIDTLIRWLPVPGYDAPLEQRSSIATRLGNYRLTLLGDLRTVNGQLAAVATRLGHYVAAMLAAVVLVWLLLEAVVMRRIVLLTRRAAAVSDGMRAAASRPASAHRLDLTLDVGDFGGRDELGVLAQGLRDLLARINADVEREQIRTRQEREQWHAVGHEIVSPLQSLMAMHGEATDPASRYLRRMQQAVRVLYGQASPSEAFESTQLTLAPLDLDAFADMVAGNAHHIGIGDTLYHGPREPAWVLADEHSLEDVLTHVLRNAERHREAGSTISLSLALTAGRADEWQLSVHNRGAAVPEALLERIFEYGVSGSASDATDGAAQATQRGQGLFVARTYMAKMGGTIVAANEDHGVRFTLALPRLARPAA